MAPASNVDLGLEDVPNHKAPISIFPDGIKTSGQHTPLFQKLKPYEEFPKAITGPTVWKKEDYANHPARWTHPFSDGEIDELSTAADSFIEREILLTGITKVYLPMPTLSKKKKDVETLTFRAT